MNSPCQIGSGLCMLISILFASAGFINYAVWFAVVANYLLNLEKYTDLV